MLKKTFITSAVAVTLLSTSIFAESTSASISNIQDKTDIQKTKNIKQSVKSWKHKTIKYDNGLEIGVDSFLSLLPKDSFINTRIQNSPGFEVTKVYEKYNMYFVLFKMPIPKKDGKGIERYQQGTVAITKDFKKMLTQPPLDIKTAKPLWLDYDMNKVYEASTFTLGKGTGNDKEIYAFTDPDCPYCVRFEKSHLKSIYQNGAVVHMLLFPLVSLHPQSFSKAVYITMQPEDKRLETLERIQGVDTAGKDDKREWKAVDDAIIAHFKDGVAIPPKMKEAFNRVNKTMEIANEMGISGTPSFISENGKKIDYRQLAKEYNLKFK